MNDRQQERRVGARPNKEVLTGECRRLGPPRVNHDYLTAASLEIFEALAHIGHRPDAAIRGKRISSEHQKVIGAIHVRDRTQQHVPKTPQ